MRPADTEKLVDTYPYRTSNGNLICELRRYWPKRFEIRDDMGRVLEHFPDSMPLYRLPELLHAEPSETVYIVEGEKDVDNLRQHGLVATTNPGGTHRGWKEEFSDHLHDRHVVIIPDADGPGKRHAATVAEALAGKAASVVLLELPGLYGRDDVSDWLQRGGNSILRLTERVEKARYAHAGLTRSPRADEKPALIWATDIEPTGKLVLLALHHRRRHDSGQKIDVAQVSAPELARMTGIHRVTAQRTIAGLRRRGVLRSWPGGRGHVIAWDILAALAGSTIPAPTRAAL